MFETCFRYPYFSREKSCKMLIYEATTLFCVIPFEDCFEHNENNMTSTEDRSIVLTYFLEGKVKQDR